MYYEDIHIQYCLIYFKTSIIMSNISYLSWTTHSAIERFYSLRPVAIASQFRMKGCEDLEMHFTW